MFLVDSIRSRIIESDKILRQDKPFITHPQEFIKIESNPDIIIDDDFDPSFNLSDPFPDLPSEEKKLEDEEEETNPLNASCSEIITITINPELNQDLKRKIQMKRTMSKSDLHCYECNITFTFREIYLQHMKKHSKISVCNICNAQVLSHNLKKHHDVHNSSPRICELCGAMAKNAESLRGHMFYMHKSTAEQYKCKPCGKFYRYKYKYDLHMRKQHGGDKTHMCDVCGKAFYTARDVKRHIEMTHLKLRPFICPYCNKGFSSSYARRTHVRQHTNEKPFRCDICAEGFRQRVSLKTHLKSKHGVIYNGQTSVQAARQEQH